MTRPACCRRSPRSSVAIPRCSETDPGCTMSMATTASLPVDRSPSRRRYDATMPLAILLALLLVTLVGLPLFWLLVTSLRDDANQWSLARYAQVLSDPAFQKPLWTSLWTSAA